MKICDVCNKETYDPYCSGSNKGSGYFCKDCQQECVEKFNELVNGDAGYTTSNEVGVSLIYIKRLIDMLQRQPEMFRLVITDEKRLEVLNGK